MPRTLTPLTAAIRQLIDEHGFDLTHSQARPLLKKMGIPIVKHHGRRSDEETEWEAAWKEYALPRGWTDEEHAELVASTVDAVRKDLGITKAEAARRHKQHLKRKEWDTEVNAFDCAKVNYAKFLQSGASPSSRPAESKNTKAQTAAAQAKTIKTWKKGGKGRKQCPSCNIYVAARSGECVCGHNFDGAAQLPPPKYPPEGAKPTTQVSVPSTSAEVDALVYVEKHGGVGEVKEALGKKQGQIEKIKADIEKLQKRLVKVEGEQAEMAEAVALVEALQKRVKAAA